MTPRRRRLLRVGGVLASTAVAAKRAHKAQAQARENNAKAP
jgi:hypothetical protein